jgi:hypothetical protein
MGLLQRVIAHAMQEWEVALPQVKNARDRRLKQAVKGKVHQSEEARLLAASTADGRERSCRVSWLRGDPGPGVAACALGRAICASERRDPAGLRAIKPSQDGCLRLFSTKKC